MATAATEINLEPVAIEWHHGKVQELTDLITTHHLAFIECCVISETKLTSRRLDNRHKQTTLLRTLGRTNGVGVVQKRNGLLPYSKCFRMESIPMNSRFRKFPLSGVAIAIASDLLFATIAIFFSPLPVSAAKFVVPTDLALWIRLDDTLTSVDSRVADPFSATVVDGGEYRNARVYGHIASIEMSRRVQGNTSMMLRFDRLLMPDRRSAPIHAEIIELYHAPSGEKVDVESAIESGGRGRSAIVHTTVGAGAGALLGGIFGGGKGAGIGPIVGGAGGLGTTAFHGHQKITLSNGLEMLIRMTGR